MTLQELRFIIALARERHFRKASNACFVSQPTLSIAIRKIEKELGIPLFERTKSEVHITPAGEDIVMRAKRVLAEVDAIKQVAEFDKDQLKGVFKLGAIFTIGPYLLPPLITSLHRLAPHMPVEIHEDYTANLREKLIAGELDAILISLPFNVSSVVTRTLYEEPFQILMPVNHPLAEYASVSENILSDHNILLLGEGHCFREQVISSCPSCFMSNKTNSGIGGRAVEGASLETIKHMVASGLGITILPSTAANMSPYSSKILTVRPFKGAKPSRSVALAWRSSFPRYKAIEKVFEAFLKCSLAASYQKKI